jgi:hypothetical protein
VRELKAIMFNSLYVWMVAAIVLAFLILQTIWICVLLQPSWVPYVL